MATEAGFELILPGDEEATFFALDLAHTSSKALQIIDRCTQMPLEEFEEAFQDPRQRGRWPIALAMIGLSIRAGRPTWSVDRIMDIVENLDIDESQLAFIGGGEEDEGDPLPEGGSEKQDEGISRSQSAESGPSSTLTEVSATPI